MKYLDAPELAHLADILEYSSAECKVHTRFEAYSCKSVSRERKLFKTLEEAYSLEQAEQDELLSMSPEMREAGLESCFGRLDQKDSRQTWFWLIALLNVAFPDHDFTGVRPDHFVRENSVNDVLSQLSQTVLELSNEGPRSYGSYPPSLTTTSSSPLSSSHSSFPSPSSMHHNPLTSPTLTHPHLRRVLDSVLQGSLAECDVYSYTPDFDSDPHAESDSDDDDEDEEDGGESSGKEDGGDEFLEGFEDDEDEFVGSDEEGGGGGGGKGGGFKPPTLNSLPLVAGNEFNQPTRRGCLWSVNYFFVSRRQKRILFISIWAKKRDPIPFFSHHHSSSLRALASASNSTYTARRKSTSGSGSGEKDKEAARVRVKALAEGVGAGAGKRKEVRV